MDDVPWFYVVMFWSALAFPLLLVASLFLLIVAHAASLNPAMFRAGTARVLGGIAVVLLTASVPGLILWMFIM